MQQIFKTISYPKEISGTGQTEILRIAFNKEKDAHIYEVVKNLSSSEMRLLLNKENYSALKNKSETEKRSLNNYCLSGIENKIQELRKSYGDNFNIKSVFSKYFIYSDFDKFSGTFRQNKTQSVHRWYPYIEGYSCSFVEEILNKLSYIPRAIYDPFAGSGTTQIVASHRGITSYYSEINPFMQFVADFKVNGVTKILEKWEKNKKKLEDFNHELSSSFDRITINHNISDELKKFFSPKNLDNLLKIKWFINQYFRNDANLKEAALFALSTNIVLASKMIRRADLRYRRENEYKHQAQDILPLFINKINEIIDDVNSLKTIKHLKINKTKLFCPNAKCFPSNKDILFDLIITSPPYINGTNYFRNTKLELLFLDFVKKLDDLKSYKLQAITAGINNVTKELSKPRELIYIKKVIKELEQKSYDKRIPRMVESYFSDMDIVFENISKKLKQNGYFYLDIGDSQFADVHIPTDKFLIESAKKFNFDLIDQKYLRERFSKNGMKLKQSLLLFKKVVSKKMILNTSNAKGATSLLYKNYDDFKKFEYKQQPYSKRNWGHNLHSLCSYQGKLKPSIAHFLVKLFTEPGMKILDPLAGVGTIPFEACLQGRFGIANDLSLMAYVNALAKINTQNEEKVNQILNEIENFINIHKVSKEDAEKIDFGYNKTLKDYYEINTLREILTARNYFKNKKINTSEDAFILASLLHILHGNRPYALSRRSHPVIPFAPQGEFVYKNLIEKLREKVNRGLKEKRPINFKPGSVYNLDFLELNNFIDKKSIDAVITSPPFFDSTKFYMSNWIRLWFMGWEKEDFNIKKHDFLETKQKKNFAIYEKFFQICKELLKQDGVIIMHLGRTKKIDMGEMLTPIVEKYFKIFDLIDESVAHVEKFGIKDQGSTHIHQFLFLHN